MTLSMPKQAATVDRRQPSPFPGPLMERALATAARGAEVAEQQRQLGADTVEALTVAGFPAHFVPRRWGGAEGGFAPLLRAVAEVGEACASAAWCAGLWAAHGRFGAYLPPEGQRELWADTPQVRIAAALAPHGAQGVRTGRGDWTVSGTWDLVSGIDHAQWVLLAAAVPEAPQERGGVRVFAVPYEDVQVVDTWHSTGLCGTGSNSVVLKPTSVPHHRTFLLADLLAGRAGEGAARCHAAPAQLAGGLIFGAPAVGAARAALRAWTAWAAPRAAAGAAASRGPLHRGLARSSAEVDAAGLMLAEAARRADEDPVTRLGVARNHRDAAVLVDLVVTAVERLFRTGGLHARDGAGTVQRCWRDVHSVAAHAVLQFEEAATHYGTEALAR
ncbi:oxidoreductase [Streptomyces sp. NPDC048111]|uniref:oxidoreductase n=1 Tax=Streptomyces sp. NPDC048111 TaxID=3365500 RepID=UPI003716F239